MMDNITDYGKIKQDMKELWRDTFHDSYEYIDLVFDTYFNPENVFVRYDENRIIAALLCVPYEFQILTKYEKKKIFRGMYLCGLATRPDHRGKGIMSSLMAEAEISASERGYRMTFLIPADAHLRDYYARRGYRTASYRRIENPSEEIDGDGTEWNIYSIKELFINEDFKFLKKLANWCRQKETEERLPTILHSEADMLAIMAENENSIFLAEETFDLKYPNLEKVAIVAFPEVPKENNAPVRVVGLYTREGRLSRLSDPSRHEARERALQATKTALSRLHPRRLVEFLLPCERSTGDSTSERREEPYVMVKNIDSNGNKDIFENLTFQICLMLD